MQLNRHFAWLTMASITAVLAIASCSPDDPIEQTDYNKVANHTVLMYLNGDNTLASALESNYLGAMKAIRDSAAVGSINLVVFKDNFGLRKLPELFWVHRNAKASLDTIPLKTFSQQVDAVSSQFFQEILSTTFSRFDTPIKGLIFGTHALGWAPSEGYTAGQNASRRAPAYIGIDETTDTGMTGYMEITDFRKALEASGVKLDYFLADACNMGNAESAYELRNQIHYMVGAPTEIEGYGFPYQKVIAKLATCQSVSDLPEALKYSITCYFDSYKNNNGATISLLDLTHVESLCTAYRNALLSEEGQKTLTEVKEMNDDQRANWQEEIQNFGRTRVRSRYYFYDVQSVIDHIAPSSAAQVAASIKAMVLKSLYTPTYYEVDVNENCGISVSIPELFVLQKNSAYRSTFQQSYDNLWDMYRKLQWGQIMGY